MRECSLDAYEHIAKGGTVAFVYDEHHSLGSNMLYICFFLWILFCVDLAHLLDGSYNETVLLGVVITHFCYQYVRILRRLYIIHRIGKRAILFQ